MMSLREDLDKPWEEYWQDGPPSARKRDFIINTFVPLARAIARKLKAGLPQHVSYDDLVSAGIVGLISAVDRYDPAKGHFFRRYCAIRIKGAMLDELRSMDWAPRSVRREGGQLRQVRRELEATLGRPATDAEVAAGMGLDAAEFEELLRRNIPQRVVQIEDLGPRRADGDRGNAFNFLTDPNSPDPSEESERKDDFRLMLAAVADLQERSRLMITFYYLEGLNLKEIALIFGVTESRVSQIHTAALEILRKKVRNMA
jgi:RNA polymerase sigma factor for flagellar operon FliA